jgi:pyruvate kinase
MRRAKLNRHAKVIATLGPATSDVNTICELILAGMSVARLNMGHGSYDEHARLINNIRQASRSVGLEVAVLLDLQGPKIRVDTMSGETKLQSGQTWVIGSTGVQQHYPEYKGCFIPTTYDGLVDDCQVGARVLFDDGLIVAEAVERAGEVYKIKILVGGMLKPHKGINLPDSKVSAPSLTKKDREDVLFGMEHGIDYIALSFVRKKEDVLHLREFLREHKSNLPIVSKIENPEGLENIKEIMDVSDVIMVARGDMGVELGNHLVPAVQKRIIALCNAHGLPVITATQMLESMVERATPTRAEASDVANPVEAVKMMGKIIQAAEETPKERPSLKELDLTSVDDATMVGASLIAEKIEARRILSVTQSGGSVFKMCRFRPRVSILGVSNSLAVVRKMCLFWGVSPFYLDDYDENDGELEHYVIGKVKNACELQSGDRIVITRGSGRFFAAGSSNSIKVVTIE